MTDKPQFRFPNATHRMGIIGRTGSGKTQAAFWFLSYAPFDRMPYYIVDYKGDDLLNSIDDIKEVGLHEKPTTHPGIYRVHPRALADDEAVEKWLWKIREQENTGLFFDEGYMLPNKGAMRTLFTQGRSLHIPIIICTQRPVRVDPFLFSECDFFAVFFLNRKKDAETAQSYLSEGALAYRLPEFHFVWHDVGKDVTLRCQPVPPADEIRERMLQRLRPGTKTTFV